MSDFEKAHAFTALWEGGYIYHPADPGGETNLGVTKANWLKWCKSCNIPVKPMKALTPADVKPLYEAWYWRPLAATLPWPLSAAIYDMSVNHGVGDGKPFDEQGNENGATWMLWRAHQLAPGGTPLQLALAACDAREQFYRGIVRRNPSQQVFMKGWMRRVNALRQWLKALPVAPPAGGVLFVPAGGGQPVPWNGKPAKYGGVLVNDELIAQLQQVYASPGGPWEYGGALKVWRRQNGDLVLERLPVTPQTIPATPPK
ncbi:MAG: glycosyl hydrolase 108 family protein [Deinococcus sp.]|uniref:glycoside hydrolase family 108 protein n=1 Tax=Deinococcus sp. TaxID=47478 RepID=UPI0026DC3B49|nr:glycosyl hydrolase 108 family protein [Deinococcus sp.]MDO4244550.1 glycosyl hydrolase 108 family protein [Deinococcus sp.]